MSHIKIQIIRAEGDDWDNSSLGCYVSLDSELIDVVTPLNSQHESNVIKVPSKGYLKLFIKTMGDSSKFLGNITVPLEVFPSKGYVWLPLMASITDSLISEIPDSVANPKILLAITRESTPLIMANEGITNEKVLNSELKHIIKELQKQLTEESKSRELLQQAYVALLSTNAKQNSSAEARESSLIHLLEQKDVEIQKLRGLIEKFENSYKHADEEKAELLRQIAENKSNSFLSVIERLTSELDETKKLFAASVKQRAFLCSQMKLAGFQEAESDQLTVNDRNLLELKAEVIQYHEEAKELRMKLCESEHLKESLNNQVFELQQIVDTEKVDSDHSASNKIDLALSQLGLNNSFKKVAQCYLVNEKIVQVITEEGKLLVKNDEELVMIEEFLNTDKSESKSFNSTLRSTSSRKSKFSENPEYDKLKKKSVKDLRLKKVPEQVLKERNKDFSVERKKV